MEASKVGAYEEQIELVDVTDGSDRRNTLTVTVENDLEERADTLRDATRVCTTAGFKRNFRLFCVLAVCLLSVFILGGLAVFSVEDEVEGLQTFFEVLSVLPQVEVLEVLANNTRL